MQNKSELALRLKLLRKEKGVKAETVANAIGVKSATYRRYEIDTKPKDEVYLALADYFNVSVDYLMGGKTSNDMTLSQGSVYRAGDESVELSPEEAKLISKLRTLSKEDFAEVENFIDFKKSSKYS